MSRFQQAIVIGGSIAGLTAARVLADHFERVTVIERDRLQGNTEFRKGVPHTRHAHLLLLRGLQNMEGMFPGLRQELVEAGGVMVSVGQELLAYMQGNWLPTFPSDMESVSCSRPLLEQTIYRRLLANPQISFLEETDVCGLLTDENRTHVTGISYRSRQHGGEAAQSLQADLVVDASGRTSDAPRWLQDLGYTPPTETTVNSFPGYATRIYEVPAHFNERWKAAAIFPAAPHNTRGVVILPLEGNRWHVTLIGIQGDYPPTDEEGFMAFLRSLPTDKIYQILKEARPQGHIIGYRRAENRLYHYDRLPRYLERFVVLGDAVYALNPVYGQGMTVATMGIQALGRCLQACGGSGDAAALTGLARHFQKELRKVIEGPWQMATGEDMRWPKTVGGEGIDLPTRLVQKYMDQFMRAMAYNADLTAQFFKVQQMVAGPETVLHPKMMWSVFTTLRRARRQATQETRTLGTLVQAPAPTGSGD